MRMRACAVPSRTTLTRRYPHWQHWPSTSLLPTCWSTHCSHPGVDLSSVCAAAWPRTRRVLSDCSSCCCKTRDSRCALRLCRTRGHRGHSCHRSPKIPRTVCAPPSPSGPTRWGRELVQLAYGPSGRAQPSEPHTSEDVWFWTARNEETPASALRKLAREAEGRVVAQVASNPSAPPEMLAELAKHADWSVRWRVAENPSTPREVVAKLARDADESVRMAVASIVAAPARSAGVTGSRSRHERRRRAC